MAEYEAILFDFDGVLVDSEPVHFECWRAILEPFGIPLDWKTYSEHCIGISDRAMLASLCVQKDPPLDLNLLIPEYPKKKQMFRDRMIQHPCVTPETLALLNELSAYKMAVVTSSGRSEVEPILEACGIRDRFQAAVFGGDVENLKPAPDPYLLAMKRLGVGRALVVEDSAPGEQSGLAAGC
ncbi:MAG TPA: HAD family phosphatase, partial [Bryobacteraceae bacterium]|nr:HAD family phosphatase [Bryobacteraceae bacterium]